MKIKYLVLLLFISANGYAQFNQRLFTDIDITEEQADTIDFKLDNILILGMGPSPTRMFLSDLSDKIIERLNKQKIQATYLYLGKTDEEAEAELVKVDKKGYNAILFLSPKGSPVVGKLHFRQPGMASTGINNIPSNSYGTVSRDTYQQLFDFQFCKAGENMLMFWNATVNIDCDPTKKYAANKTATKILNRFKEIGYINK